jgi:hypothetical protein
MKEVFDWVALIANVLTAGASAIAIYLFFFKGKYISSVFRVLLSYASQLTLSELKDKLDALNELHAPGDTEEIVNVLHEIVGQLRGNPRLTPQFTELIAKIERLTIVRGRVNEPAKRALVSELREKIRHVGLLNFEDIAGDGK